MAKFAAIWGTRWLDVVAAVPAAILSAEWAEGLAGLTGEQIRTGLHHCRANSHWPPSIAEFRSACLDSAPRLTVATSHRLAKLDRVTPTAEARAAAMAQLEALRASLPKGEIPAPAPKEVPDDTADVIDFGEAKRRAAEWLSVMTQPKRGAA